MRQKLQTLNCTYIADDQHFLVQTTTVTFSARFQKSQEITFYKAQFSRSIFEKSTMYVTLLLNMKLDFIL
jgi:hypothetical protein